MTACVLLKVQLHLNFFQEGLSHMQYHPSELGPTLSGEAVLLGRLTPTSAAGGMPAGHCKLPHSKALSLTECSNFTWSKGWLRQILEAEQLTAAVLTTPDE